MNHTDRGAAIQRKDWLGRVMDALADADRHGVGGTYRAAEVLCESAGIYRHPHETIKLFAQRLRHEAVLERIALANNPDTETS